MFAQPPFVKPLRDPAQIRECQGYDQQDEASPQAESEPALWGVFDSFLTAVGPAQHRGVMLTPPRAPPFPYASRSADRCVAQRELVRRVIADHPFAPEGRHRIQ